MSGWIRRKCADDELAREREAFLANCYGEQYREIRDKNRRNRELWFTRFKRDPLADAVPNAQARQG